MASYKMFEKECEICGKVFRRSAKAESPPRFCGRDCLYQARSGVKFEKYIVPEKWHDIIRRMYADGVGHGEVAMLAKKIGVPRTKITNLARNKGWIPKKYSKDWSYYWCEKEDEIIIKHAHYAPVSIQRKLKKAGFERSSSAIEIRMAKLRAKSYREGMSANELAMCMGVDVHNILNAIKRGKLKADKRPGYEGDRVAYYIHAKHIAEYIKAWLPEININLIDKYWLVDVLSA